MKGRLSLVGTPIGNLGDITLRAVKRLKEVTRIYAEDTRRTRVLLSHLGIEGKQLLSLHAHSSDRAVTSAIDVLNEGHDVALVTDAGMPGVSDPGAELVRAAREAEIEVDVIPGPSAVTSAVALSGLVDGPFSFIGFLPRKGSKRTLALSAINESAWPVVLFESPHRMHETLRDLALACEESRTVAVCRELTKKFEETIVRPLGEISAENFRETWQGEFTLVVDKSPNPGVRREAEEFDFEARVLSLLAGGTSVKSIAQILAKELAQYGEKTSRRELYARVLEVESKAAAENSRASEQDS